MQMTIEMQLKCLAIRRESAVKVKRTYDVDAISDEISFLDGILKKAAKKQKAKK